jgi:hypothetical protein
VAEEIVRPALHNLVEAVKQVVRIVIAWFTNLWKAATEAPQRPLPHKQISSTPGEDDLH